MQTLYVDVIWMDALIEIKKNCLGDKKLVKYTINKWIKYCDLSRDVRFYIYIPFWL